MGKRPVQSRWEKFSQDGQTSSGWLHSGIKGYGMCTNNRQEMQGWRVDHLIFILDHYIDLPNSIFSLPVFSIILQFDYHIQLNHSKHLKKTSLYLKGIYIEAQRLKIKGTCSKSPISKRSRWDTKDFWPQIINFFLLNTNNMNIYDSFFFLGLAILYNTLIC